MPFIETGETDGKTTSSFQTHETGQDPALEESDTRWAALVGPSAERAELKTNAGALGRMKLWEWAGSLRAKVDIRR